MYSRIITHAIAIALVLLGFKTVHAKECKNIPTRMKSSSLFFEAKNLTKEDVADLERSLVQQPENVTVRSELVNYYALKSGAAMEEGRKHALWLVVNCPTAPMASGPIAYLVTRDEHYAEFKEAWLTQIEAHPQEVDVLSNAAWFLILRDTDLARRLAQRALDAGGKKDPARYRQLAMTYELALSDVEKQQRQTFAVLALDAWEKVLDGASEKTRFVYLSKAAKAAMKAALPKKAESYARELVSLAPKYVKNWNYGNAIHHGNLVLGHIALGHGDRQEAGNRLKAAGRTPGSPQLDSFGPNMTLAKALIEVGETKVVIEYLELCRKFWGGDELNVWIKKLQEGESPDFGANLQN